VAQICYALCAITSIICFGFLSRAYVKNKTLLLLWSSLCFFFLALQNSLLFIDLVLVPQVNLSLWRTLAGLIGPAILLCGLIWEKR
jgi:hypothetical protein